MEKIIGGSNSIIIPSTIHKNYTFNFNKDSVCKVTSSINCEIVIARCLNSLRSPYVNKYFTYMNTDSLRKLVNNKAFTNFVKTLSEFNDMNRPSTDFYYFTMNYSGQDLFEMCCDESPILFKSEQNFKTMLNQLLEGICFLHDKRICHFDIKPENITYCLYDRHFKYIDFGYAENYPFVDYIHNGPKGTPDYIPISGNTYFMEKLIIDPKTPYIKCNDWTPKNDGDYNSRYVFYNTLYPNLAYKVDSFALGKTIYYIYYFLLNINNDLTAKFKNSVEALIYDLIHTDIILRPYLSNIDLKRYYKLKKKSSIELSPEFGSREYLYHESSNIDYGTRLLNTWSSSSDTSVSSDTSGSKKTSDIEDTRSNERNNSDTLSISSIEIQNSSRGCLSNMLNKLSFKKLILKLF